MSAWAAALTRLVDRWVARAAAPDPSALAAVAERRPATVITGASRGIGLALASRFADAGHDVVLIARSRPELAAAADGLRARATGLVLALPLDVAAADAGEAIDRFLVANDRYCDVLVNNAAVGLGGPFEASLSVAIDDLVALNIGAVTRLLRHFLPAMKARGRGGILNIASLGGAVPGPYQAAYYASKAYVMSLSEAVAAESAGTGVRITVVAPGPVQSGFHAAMGAEDAMYRRLLPALSPERVARSAFAGFMFGRRVVYPGLLAPIAAMSVRVLPHAMTVPLVGWLLDNRPSHRRT